MSTGQATVLVVDDEEPVADAYAAYLRDEYAVRIAYSGEEALESLDDDVDAVLLDRRMPGLTGDEVLSTVRDRGLTCRVAMVTAVEPDFDIVDMGFDDYLVKPVVREELLDAVEGLLRRATYHESLQTFFSLASKRALLREEMTAHELRSSDAYDRLVARLERLEAELDATLEEFPDEEAFEVALDVRDDW